MMKSRNSEITIEIMKSKLKSLNHIRNNEIIVISKSRTPAERCRTPQVHTKNKHTPKVHLFIIAKTHIMSVQQCQSKSTNESTEATSTIDAGRLVHLGMVLGKKQYL